MNGILKKNKIKKDKRNLYIQACVFIQKIHKVSCIHKCTLKKRTENQISCTHFYSNKKFHAFLNATFKKRIKNQISCI